MIEELNTIGIEIPNKVKVIIIFMNLLESYQYLITMLESIKEKSYLGWHEYHVIQWKFIRKEKEYFSQTM